MNQIKNFYEINRANGMKAAQALEYARSANARIESEVHPLPSGKARSKLIDSIWPKRRPAVQYNPRNAQGEAWLENASGGLRVKAAHEILNLQHRGWFTNDSQDSTRGAIIQLPARNGKPRFYASLCDEYNPDCYRVDFSTVYECEKEAARAGNSMAEKYAEQAREYDEAERAGQGYLAHIESAQEARKAALELIADFKAERREGKTTRESICAAIRSKIAEQVAQWRKGKEQAAKLVDSLYYGPDSRNEEWRDLWAAFAETAQIKINR